MLFLRVNITRKGNKRSTQEFVVLQMYQVSTKAASALISSNRIQSLAHACTVQHKNLQNYTNCHLLFDLL